MSSSTESWTLFYDWAAACFGVEERERSAADVVIYRYFGSGSNRQPPGSSNEACQQAAEGVVLQKCWGLFWARQLFGSSVYSRALKWSGIDNTAPGCIFQDVSTPDSMTDIFVSCPANSGLVTYNYPGLRRGILTLYIKPNGTCYDAPVYSLTLWSSGGLSVWNETELLLCDGWSADSAAACPENVTLLISAPQASLRLVPAEVQTYMGDVAWLLECHEFTEADPSVETLLSSSENAAGPQLSAQSSTSRADHVAPHTTWVPFGIVVSCLLFL